MAQVKDLEYYKNNAEEDYMTTPISVLRYIGELEAELHKTPVVRWNQHLDLNFNKNLDIERMETPKQKTMTVEQILEIAKTSPALEWQSDRGGRADYPARYRGRVPLKVMTAKTVKPDLMELHHILNVKSDTICLKDNEYYVWVNSYGAVSAILPNGEKLGLLPSEFDVTEWH